MSRKYSRPYVCYLYDQNKAVVRRAVSLGDNVEEIWGCGWIFGPFKTASAARYFAVLVNNGDIVYMSGFFQRATKLFSVVNAEREVRQNWVRQPNGTYWPTDVDGQRKANEVG